MKSFSICLLLAGAQAIKLMQDTAADGPMTAAGLMTDGPMTAGPMTLGPMTDGPMTDGPMTAGPMTGTAADMDTLMGPMFACEGTSCDDQFDDTMLPPLDPVTGMPLPPPGPMDPSMAATDADLGLDDTYDEFEDEEFETED